MYDIDSNGSIDRSEMLKIIEVNEKEREGLHQEKSIYVQSIYDLLGAAVTQNASNGTVSTRDPTDTPENRTAQIFAVMVSWNFLSSIH